MAEPSYAAFSAKLSPGITRPMLGVRLPQLRKLGKELAIRADWRDIYTILTTAETFEEQLLCGFLLGYAKPDFDEFIRLLPQFIPLIDGWAVCDCCCASFTLVARHREEAWPFLVENLKSDETYRQRFGTVMLMDHFRTPEFTPRVLDAYTTLRPNGYYAEMGLAWALSVFVLSMPEKVLSLLRSNTWSVNVRLLTCRKILESHRTPQTLRQEIPLLRRQIRNSDT